MEKDDKKTAAGKLGQKKRDYKKVYVGV